MFCSHTQFCVGGKTLNLPCHTKSLVASWIYAMCPKRCGSLIYHTENPLWKMNCNEFEVKNCAQKLWLILSIISCRSSCGKCFLNDNPPWMQKKVRCGSALFFSEHSNQTLTGRCAGDAGNGNNRIRPFASDLVLRRWMRMKRQYPFEFELREREREWMK